MQFEGLQLNPNIFVALLNACASLMAFENDRQVEIQISHYSSHSDIFVDSSIIDMYTTWKNIEDAWRAFDEMPTHNVVFWNAMIMGHMKWAGLVGVNFISTNALGRGEFKPCHLNKAWTK